MVSYIGKRIRENKGYTIKQLAEESTVAPSTICKWENNKAIPDLNVLYIVACTLKCSPWDLVQFKED